MSIHLLTVENEPRLVTAMVAGSEDQLPWFMYYNTIDEDIMARPLKCMETYVTYGETYTSKEFGSISIPINWSMMETDGDVMVSNTSSRFKPFSVMVFNPHGNFYPRITSFRWSGMTKKQRWYVPLVDKGYLPILPLKHEGEGSPPCILVSPDKRNTQVHCGDLL